jgi:molybdopterin molybdotransferase
MTPGLLPLSLHVAISWVDQTVSRLPAELAPMSSICRRVLAESICATHPIPVADRALLDGFAVDASATIGAGSYNPLLLPLRTIAAGDTIPPGTDAVIALDLAQILPSGVVECIETVLPSQNVEMRGCVAIPGTLLASAGTLLLPAHMAMLISAGLGSVMVVRQPVVRIVLTSDNSVTDSDGPMCRALVERDGGLVANILAAGRNRQAITDALATEGADVVLVIGGTGPGACDHAAAALAEIGNLAIHGVALRPGETAGLGHTNNATPVILLPGSPAACLFAYEMLGGRAIRRLGGRDPALPFRSRVLCAARKIVSAIGMTEICPVHVTTSDAIEPLPPFSEIGLMAAVAADGFVIVPEEREGYPQGAAVTVYLYEGSCIGG